MIQQNELSSVKYLRLVGALLVLHLASCNETQNKGNAVTSANVDHQIIFLRGGLTNTVKINVDSALVVGVGRYTSVLVRDHDGNLIVDFQTKIVRNPLGYTCISTLQRLVPLDNSKLFVRFYNNDFIK